MKSLTIIPITEKGKEALRIHQEEKHKQNAKDRRRYEKIIREEREGDNLTLSYVKKGFNALLTGDYITFVIKDVLYKNGAFEGVDYTLKVEK